MCCILLISYCLMPLSFSHLSDDEPHFDSVAELLDALKDSSPKARADASRFIFGYLLSGKKFEAIDAKHIVAAMVPLANATEKPVRYEVAAALFLFAERQGVALEQKMAVKGAIDILLKDKDGRIRIYAAEALHHLDPDKKADAIAAIEACFKDQDSRVRFDAATAFRSLASKRKAEIVPVLESCLKDTNTCAHAAIVLEQLGTLALPAVPALSASLKDADPYNRVSVASALVAIDPKQNAKVIPVLVEMLVDETWRGNAAQVLERIGREAKNSIPRLREIAKLPPDQADMAQRLSRLSAIGALTKIDPEFRDALDAFVAALRDKDIVVRGNTVYRLGELGPQAKPAVKALVEVADADPRFMNHSACVALEKIGPGAKEAIPFLESLLENKDESIRESAAKALKAIKQGIVDPENWTTQ